MIVAAASAAVWLNLLPRVSRRAKAYISSVKSKTWKVISICNELYVQPPARVLSAIVSQRGG